ncbi:MAG: hypothetical protein Q9174_003797 [Haloplaca sp. 1 TL-2023]
MDSPSHQLLQDLKLDDSVTSTGHLNQLAPSVPTPAIDNGTTTNEIPLGRRLERLPHNIHIREYFSEKSDTFYELNKLRDKGWQSATAADHFKKQRKSADKKTLGDEEFFFGLHKKIGRELQGSGAFNLGEVTGVKTLNLCMAPGGYTVAILNKYPDAFVAGITLPHTPACQKINGHAMKIRIAPEDPRVHVHFMDITMLLSEMTNDNYEVAPSHPDAANFIRDAPFKAKSFDLVLCDGIVLRTHDRPEVREAQEPIRLLSMQLVYGMARIKSGGTFIILLRKVDTWDTCTILSDFCSFARVSLFKPKAAHTDRSSFYMVAKSVIPDCAAAQQFIKKWQQVWMTATFGGEQGTGTDPEAPSAGEVNTLLKEFGPRLMSMAGKVWAIQLEALKDAKWIDGPSTASSLAANQSSLFTKRRRHTSTAGSASSSRQSSAVEGPMSWRPHTANQPEHSAPPFTMGHQSRASLTQRPAFGDENMAWRPSTAAEPQTLAKPAARDRRSQFHGTQGPSVDMEKQEKMAGKWR